MAIDLNNITGFFRPNRQVCQNELYGSSNIDTDVDADSEHDPDAETSVDYGKDKASGSIPNSFMQVMEIMNKAKRECKNTEKAICSLEQDEVWNIAELNRFRKFIDELDYKFSVLGADEEPLKLTTERYDRLSEQLDMEKLTREFLRAKDYKIYKYHDNSPGKDKIVFNYKNRKKKGTYILEMAVNLPPLDTNEAEDVKEEEVVDEYGQSKLEESLTMEQFVIQFEQEGQIKEDLIGLGVRMKPELMNEIAHYLYEIEETDDEKEVDRLSDEIVNATIQYIEKHAGDDDSLDIRRILMEDLEIIEDEYDLG